MKIFDLFKKPLDSVSDEITSKFKTPLFLTYVAVWIIRNNKFVYDLFFNSNIQDKTNILNFQFNISEREFYLQTFLTILIALVVMVIYYIFINFSRVITILSEERIKLNILDKLKSKTITTIEDVDYWRSKSKNLETRNQSLEIDINSLRTSLKSSNIQLNSEKEEKERLIKSIDGVIDKIKEVLENSLYDNSILKDSKFGNDIQSIKKKFDQEFINYENAKEAPGFLMTK